MEAELEEWTKVVDSLEGLCPFDTLASLQKQQELSHKLVVYIKPASKVDPSEIEDGCKPKFVSLQG